MNTSLARGVDSDDERLRILADAPQFPGLTILGLLSHGDDLDVFDVWCSSRRARCVLKAVRADRVDNRGVMVRFHREADLVMGLSHPNIVRGYATGESPLPYLLQETLTGHTLAGLTSRRRGLTRLDVLNLGDQLSAALAYLHDHGFLHLDLKPSNIIVESGRVKLIDFSLAHSPGKGPAGWGTPDYLAPEQDNGDDFTAATDVWGLGMVLKEASTRRMPVAFRTMVAGCLRPLPEERPSLAEVRRVITESLGVPNVGEQASAILEATLTAVGA